MAGGVLQQPAGQLDARRPAHPEPLPPEGPHHAGPIGDHQLGRLDHGAQLGIGPGRHGHFGVESHHLAAPGVHLRFSGQPWGSSGVAPEGWGLRRWSGWVGEGLGGS